MSAVAVTAVVRLQNSLHIQWVRETVEVAYFTITQYYYPVIPKIADVLVRQPSFWHSQPIQTYAKLDLTRYYHQTFMHPKRQASRHWIPTMQQRKSPILPKFATDLRAPENFLRRERTPVINFAKIWRMCLDTALKGQCISAQGKAAAFFNTDTAALGKGDQNEPAAL